MIKLSQDDLTAGDDVLTLDKRLADIAKRQEATSMRQVAEWGVLAVQSSFLWNKVTLPYEEYRERKRIMTSL